MRKYLIGFVFAACTAASFSAFAQDPPSDQLQTPGIYCDAVSEPPSDQVWVFRDVNYQGPCATLIAGFYPNSGTGYGTFGLPNDSISSIKIGNSLRARLFSNGVYSGNSILLWGDTDYPTMPSGWNEVVSSIRVESYFRSPTCNDLQQGEFALFTNANRTGDCVILKYANANNYQEPIEMGIANDSISSVDTGPTVACPGSLSSFQREYLVLYSNGYAEGGGTPYRVASGVPDDDPSKKLLSSFNDVTSATGTICLGYTPN